MLGKVDEAAKRLSSNQITAEQLIEAQVEEAHRGSDRTTHRGSGRTAHRDSVS